MSKARLVMSIAKNERPSANTFLTSKSPMNANGRPGSCTGKREKPLSSLLQVQPLHSRERRANKQMLQFLVIKHIVGTDGNNVLKRKPNQGRRSRNCRLIHGFTYLHRSHYAICPLAPQFQDTAQDGNLVVLQGFFALSVELQERLEFCLLVSVGFVRAKDVVEQFGDGPRYGC